MKRGWFQVGIANLLDLADQQTTAILCSEKDPLTCHRRNLVARYLWDHHPGVEVLHILYDGGINNERGQVAAAGRTEDSCTGQAFLIAPRDSGQD
jgi:hypothetical protein